MKLLKSLFRSFAEKEVQRFDPQQIHIRDIGEWLDQRSGKLIEKYHLQEAQEKFIVSFNDKRWLIECALDEWDNRLDSLEKNQREQVCSLFAQVRSLLEKAELDSSLSLFELFEKLQFIEKENELLLKRIAQHSFADNYAFLLSRNEHSSVNPLLKILVELDSLREQFTELVIKSRLKNVRELSRRQKKLDSYADSIYARKQQLKAKTERLMTTKKKQEEQEDELQKLKEDKEINDLSHLADKGKELRTRRFLVQEDVSSLFLTIRPAIEDFLRSHPEHNLLGLYLKDPLKALVQDENVSITHPLQQMIIFLESGQSSLELAKVHAMIPVIEKLSSGYLFDLQQRYTQIQLELQKHSVPLKNKLILDKIEEMNYRIEHFHAQTDHLEEETSVLEEEIKEQERLLLYEKEQFENLVKLGLGLDLEIKL